MSNISSVRLSGTTYQIKDNSAPKVVELTQAEYDALQTKDPNTFYVITDAQGADLSNYWTSAQTQSAITESVSGKVDTSTFETYSGSVETALSGKQDALSAGTGIDITDNVISVTGGSSITIDPSLDSGSTNPVANSAITTALSGKQETLSAGTGIDITDNVISVTGGGGGGGKAVSAGTNISITTGETADTINCTLPISADSKGIYTTSDYPFLSNSYKTDNVVFGKNNRLDTFGSNKESRYNLIFGKDNIIQSANGNGMLWGGLNNKDTSTNLHNACVVLGNYNNISNMYEFACGNYNVSNYSSGGYGNSGNTLFSVGNGDSYRHNAFEIRQNGDIYISDTNATSTERSDEKPMIKLQDALGGSSITIDPTLDSGSTNPVANSAITTALSGKVDNTTYTAYTASTDAALSGKVDNSDVTSAVTSGSTDVVTSGGVYDQLGGMKIVKLTESQYTALVTKDESTLYVVVPDPSN